MEEKAKMDSETHIFCPEGSRYQKPQEEVSSPQLPSALSAGSDLV